MEGVNENGVLKEFRNRCYDTQRTPLPRPSAPKGYL